MLETSVPTQVTSARIASILKDNGAVYFVDSNGEIGLVSDGRIFQFILLGEQRENLIVRGRWNRSSTIERANEFLEFCNRWNSATIWPKTYYRVRDDGEVLVFAEVNYDLEYGVTTAQLESILDCGVQTATRFFDELDSVYPDPVKVKP